MRLNSRFAELLAFRVYCRLKSEAAGTYLSFLWWILEPIFYIVTFYVVFGLFLRRGTEDFVAFLVCGLIPWSWFQKTVIHSSSALLSGKNLLVQTKIPIVIFPLEVIVQDLFKQIVVFVLLLLFLFFYGIDVTHAWMLILVIIVVQLAFTSAIAFVAAAIVPIIPDFRYFIQTGLMLLMFGSGVFYHYEDLGPEYQSIFLLNPVANLLASYRGVLLYDTFPNWIPLLVIFGLSSAVVMIVTYIFYTKSDVFTRIATES